MIILKKYQIILIAMKRIVVHFVRFRNGGDYEKLTLPVMVQVFIAFKKVIIF